MGLQADLGFAGEVVERQEFLNGTQVVTLEGEGPDGAVMTGLLTWSMRSSQATEGDVTIAMDDGSEIFATLTGGRVSERAEGEGGHAFTLAYEIDGGSGAHEGARGAIAAHGVIEESTFSGTWRIDLAAG